MIYRVRIDDLMDPSCLELYEKVNEAAPFYRDKEFIFHVHYSALFFLIFSSWPVELAFF